MKRACILFLTGIFQLSAQDPQPAPQPAPQVGTTLNQLRLNGTSTIVSVGGPVVKGRPFSATEENRTVQVLGNGTKIENKTTTKLFRDVDGRTRSEDSQGTIVIADPVAGFRATLSPKTKTATKNIQGGGRGGAFGTVVSAGVLRNVSISKTGSELRENLGVQSVNGVAARGERLTVTIPKGDIGNDREIKVVTERWTSEELQMLVKSTNSDPRYGDTTYELTGISMAAPNLTLFQIPSDYTITETGTAPRVVTRQVVPAVPALPGVPAIPATPAPRGARSGRK